MMTKETALATARDYVKLHDKREARVHVAEMTNMRNYLKDALDAICKEIDATGSKAFGYEALLKYEGVTPAMLGGVIIDMRRRGKIVSCEDGLMFAEDVEPVNIISTCTHK